MKLHDLMTDHADDEAYIHQNHRKKSLRFGARNSCLIMCECRFGWSSLWHGQVLSSLSPFGFGRVTEFEEQEQRSRGNDGCG